MIDLSTRILTASLGKTHIFSVGQAGFIIKSSTGRLLGIDLYLSDCVERLEGHKGFKRLLPKILFADEIEFDAIICTHAHLDHFDKDSVPGLISNGKTKLFCSYECRTLVDRFQLGYHQNQISYVKPGDNHIVGDFSISFVDCDHGEAALDAVGVVVSVDNRIIYETGDTCLRLDYIKQIPKSLDILIAPINGAFGNLNEEECSILSELLSPKLTIPCHYGMFASHHGDVGRFYEIMRQKQLPVLLMCQGEQYTF